MLEYERVWVYDSAGYDNCWREITTVGGRSRLLEGDHDCCGDVQLKCQLCEIFAKHETVVRIR